jgi:hypothetical protein
MIAPKIKNPVGDRATSLSDLANRSLGLATASGFVAMGGSLEWIAQLPLHSSHG